MLRFFSRNTQPNTEEQAYRRLFEKGFRPRTIIDVGAYEGNWTRMARSVFPDAASLVVEPQASKATILQRLAQDLPDTQYVSALLAAEAGREVTFYEMETGSSIFPEQSNVPRRETHFVTRTLDEIAAGAEHPAFLKIDAQGAELEILKGAAATLEKCEVVQLEVALLPYNAGAPVFLETVTHMDGLGFVPHDFSGFSRPGGVDLVQVDILFVRKTSALRPTFFNF